MDGARDIMNATVTVNSVTADDVAIAQAWVDRLVATAVAAASKTGHMPKIVVTAADLLYMMQVPQGTKPH